MQKQIEPTYLRYVYDSLSLNTIHKDNISALPEGLIGMYEEAILNEQNVSSRERFLKFFTAWSLLKKEVSTTLMADLLDWEEWEVIDFISAYTKWFNSPSSGKYLLYHERLRVFFLQKISSHQLNQTNQTIISKCQLALEQRIGDEWEVYALEHLPSHLLVAAMQSEADGVVLKKLVYDTSFWNRQIEISKGYEWSKRMLNQAMSWAAKQNTDEIIECALNKIDLYHMEQNDAPRIVELVAQNDIETALQRIESFGGNDKEGLQRKFILYMLCLMELTLLESKEKPFRRDAIEKILKHFDEKMQIVHSILNWNDFFSSYLMFQMSCEWAELELDYLIVYRRSFFSLSWIKEKGYYTHMQFKVLLECALCLSDLYEKSKALLTIQSELFNQNRIEESNSVIEDVIDIAQNIDSEFRMNEVFGFICSELVKRGEIIKVLECANKIKDDNKKNRVLNDMSIELAKKGMIDVAIDFAHHISEDSENKSISFQEISIMLGKLGEFGKAIECTKDISIEWRKSTALQEISFELGKKDNLDKALECTNLITVDWIRSKSISDIVFRYINKNQFDFALNQIDRYIDFNDSNGLIKIAYELKSKNENNLFLKYFDKAIEIARTNKDWESYYYRFEELVKIIIHHEDYDLAFKVIEDYKYRRRKYRVSIVDKGKEDLNELVLISKGIHFAKNGYFDKAVELLSDLGLIGYSALANHYILEEKNIDVSTDLYIKYLANNDEVAEKLSFLFCENGQIEEALKVINNIENPYSKNTSLINIGTYLLSNNQYEAGFQILLKCELKQYTLFEICLLFKEEEYQSKFWNFICFLPSEKQINVLIYFIDSISIDSIHDFALVHEHYKKILKIKQIIKDDFLLEYIFKKYSNSEDINTLIKIIENIDSSIKKAELYIELGHSRINKANQQMVFQIWQNALIELNKSKLQNEDDEIDLLFSKLSLCMLKIDQYDESIKIAYLIDDEINISVCLIKLSTILLEKNNPVKSDELIKLAFSNLDEIDYDPNLNEWKYQSFPEIVHELSTQGKIEYALEVSKSIPDWGDVDMYRDESIFSIIKYLALKNDYKKAIELCDEILFLEIRVEALLFVINFLTGSEIIIEIMNKILACAKNSFNLNEIAKYKLLIKISNKIFELKEKANKKALIKLEEIEVWSSVLSDALTFVRGIKKDSDKCIALKDISIELWNQGNIEEGSLVMEESLECAYNIENKWDRSSKLAEISTEITKYGNWGLAIKTSLEIHQITKRHECWKGMAKSLIDQLGCQNSLYKIIELSNNETKDYFLKGWAESIKQNEVNSDLLQQSIGKFQEDFSSLENLLQKFALNQLFFSNTSSEKLNRLNRTLNIQWAIDIANNFNKN